MKTTTEILNAWDTEQYADWYAVDKLTTDGRMLRLLVSDRDDCAAFAADRITGAGLTDPVGDLAAPGEFGEAPFYRMTLISAQAAYDYMRGLASHIERTGEMLTLSEAAEYMGTTRPAVHHLIQRGRLCAEMLQGQLRINAASCGLFQRMK